MYEMLHTMRDILIRANRAESIIMPHFVFEKALPKTTAEAIERAIDELEQDGLVSVVRDERGHLAELSVTMEGRQIALLAERNENWQHFMEDAACNPEHARLSAMILWQRQDIWGDAAMFDRPQKSEADLSGISSRYSR